MFQAYAQEEIKQALDRGATNVVPLIKAAVPVNRPPQPRELTGDVAKRTPGNPAPGDTKKRLGLMWA